MTTETAVTRLHRGVQSDKTDGFGFVPVKTVDAEALLQIIADLCDDHTLCSLCSIVLCDTCGIGEAAGCADRHAFEDHCVDCAGDCNVCRREVHESYEVDLAMDGRHS